MMFDIIKLNFAGRNIAADCGNYTRACSCMLHMHSGSHTVLIHLFILKGTKLSKYKNAVFMKKKILFEVCRKVKHTCNPVKYLHDRNF